MAKDRKKKRKPSRNPFAGRPQSGAGPHSVRKYSKKDRRRAREDIEDDTGSGKD